jgi:hypothetical protein
MVNLGGMSTHIYIIVSNGICSIRTVSHIGNIVSRHTAVYIQNSEVNNVSNAIIIQKANTKSSAGQHGPSTNAKVESDALEE